MNVLIFKDGSMSAIVKINGVEPVSYNDHLSVETAQ